MGGGGERNFVPQESESIFIISFETNPGTNGGIIISCAYNRHSKTWKDRKSAMMIKTVCTKGNLTDRFLITMKLCTSTLEPVENCISPLSEENMWNPGMSQWARRLKQIVLSLFWRDVDDLSRMGAPCTSFGKWFFSGKKSSNHDKSREVKEGVVSCFLEYWVLNLT